MRNKYKAKYGIYAMKWNRKKENLDIFHKIIYHDGNLLDYKNERNIFDINKKSYMRIIKFSEIMNIEDLDKLKIILEKLKECDYVIIDFDYKFNNNSEIMYAFILKRLRQIFEYFYSNLKNSNVMIGMKGGERNIMDYYILKDDILREKRLKISRKEEM